LLYIEDYIIICLNAGGYWLDSVLSEPKALIRFTQVLNYSSGQITVIATHYTHRREQLLKSLEPIVLTRKKDVSSQAVTVM